MSDHLIMCPHCGQPVNIADERASNLTPRNVQVWHELTHVVRPGAWFNVAKTAAKLFLTDAGLHYHLKPFVAAGLVERKLIKSEGGERYTYRIPPK